MPSLKEVRTRIESVKSTEQITSAMKMVSASKLRKAQSAIQDLQPYAEKMETLIHHVFQTSEPHINTLFNEQRPPEKILLIAIASNRGLCGNFNTNIGKMVIQHLAENYKQQYSQGNVEIFTIGKKLFEYLDIRNIKVTRRNDDLVEKLNPHLVETIVDEIIHDFQSGKYDRIELVYHHFKNAAVYLQTTCQFLPLEQQSVSSHLKPQNEIQYIFKPSIEEVLKTLIPKWLNLKLYEVLANSAASEHGARMISMHKATDNAKELLRNLRLSYNKARQTSITNEIIEIIGGAESFNK
ncbi:MAG TPA: ATP synthase F1 subunit gamma [Bacteroidales bacterium]|nr:ATP synthase F1 subunit gamma [Bacteroidales bacterium]HPR56860.1 ATP synthase F1 subunit gamma [Bacteroidales bacterium]HRW96525.1 ATP synthase F1 subunit gamma [Bacteroidales bacterium]